MSVVRAFAVATLTAVVLSGCSGSSDSAAQGPFSVGGTVTGLSGTGLVLNDGTEDLSVAASGTFTFPTKLAVGTAYAVTVKTQPSSPPQDCTVSSGSGTIGTANVTDVSVTCATRRYAVGGTVAGLAGTGLKLRNNGGDEIDVAAGATTFAFPTRIQSGGAYAVTVVSQPAGPSQSCTVANASGTVGAADVTNVAVTCATSTFTVKGTLAGLAGGSVGLRLVVGATPESLTLAGNGPFVFTTLAPSGATFTVSVTAQPTTPPQVCSVAPTSGTVGNADVSLQVVCATNAFHVGGTVTGLLGTGLVITNNGGDDLPVTGNGGFTFPVRVAKGAPYVVAVKAKPGSPSQTCAIGNGSGVIGDADVTNVQLTCTTDTFAVGGTVTGLAASSSVVLQNNGANDLTVSANGPFAFSTPIESGRAYAVTVRTNPSSPVVQTCTVANGTGVVAAGPVSSVVVTCVSNKFQLGGTLSGLAASSSVVLQNNLGDNLTLTGNGPFNFSTLLDSGAHYSVSVLTNPASPVSQTCTVTNGTGTIGTGPVTNVQVACVANRFTVGGTLSGLAASSSVVLQNNLGDNLTLSANGNFTFATNVASGSAYSVTVLTNPSAPVAQTCTVTGGTGTMAGANVTNVQVTCATSTFAVGGTLSGLAASSSVVLQNNLGDNLTRSANGSFTFATSVASGAAYSVTVLTNPSSPVSQTCTVTNGSGTVGTAPVTSVQVTCVTNQFTVGGTLSGLAASSSVVLQNNLGDNLTLSANAGFTFVTSVASGAAYSVTVLTNPASQACTVTNGAGTMGGANVTNVQVSCVTQTVIQRWDAPATWGGTAAGFWPDSDPTLVQHMVVTSSGLSETKLLTPWATPPAGVTFRQFTGFGPGLTRWGAGLATTTSSIQTTGPDAGLNALTGNMIACAVIKPDWNPVWDTEEKVIFANGIQGQSGWVLMQMHEAWCFHYQGVNHPVTAYNPSGGTMSFANTWLNDLDQNSSAHSDTGPLNSSFVVVCGGRDDTTGKIIVAANNFSQTGMSDTPTTGIGPMAGNPNPVTIGNYVPPEPGRTWAHDWNGRIYETAVWNLPATRANVQAKMNQVLGLAPLADGSPPEYRRDTEAPFMGPESTPAYHVAYRHGPRFDATKGLLFGLQGVNHVPWSESFNWWTYTPAAGAPGAPSVSVDPVALPFPPGDSEIRSGDVVTLPPGASLRVALDPFFNPGRLQGHLWLAPAPTPQGGTLTVRTEATTTPAGGGVPTVVARGTQSVTIPSAAGWVRRPLTALNAEPPPPPVVPPALPPTFTQTLILENQSATATIAFGIWGASLTQVSPNVGVSLDLGISNYDSLLGGVDSEYLSLPPVTDALASGVCLAATVQPATETPWDVNFRRPRALMTLVKTDPVTAATSFAKLVALTGGMGTDQQICFYVNDGTNPSYRTCIDIPGGWDPPTVAHTVKGCLSSAGQLRIYLDGSTTPATPNVPADTATVVPNLQGGQVQVGSNEFGAHIWSGWVKKVAVCRNDGNIAQCQ
jgi:hypothetical protein